MRLFAAVLPPTVATDELAAAVRDLRALPGAGGLRWTGQEHWHFTLAFLGEVEEATLPELTERLSRAATRCTPFPLRLHGGGHFGGRALWAGAAGDIGELRRLAERAGAAARRAGVTMDEHRRHRPHLTLARSRAEGVDLGPYVEALDSYEGTSWQVSDVSLVRSHLPDGRVPGTRPRYETLLRRPLGRGGDSAPGTGR